MASRGRSPQYDNRSPTRSPSPSRGRSRPPSFSPKSNHARSNSPLQQRYSRSLSRYGGGSVSPPGRGNEHRHGSPSPGRDLNRHDRVNDRSRSATPVRSTKVASKARGAVMPHKSTANVEDVLLQIVVERLTKNVNEDHLYEIFGQFGQIRDLDLPMSRICKFNRSHGSSIRFVPMLEADSISGLMQLVQTVEPLTFCLWTSWMPKLRLHTCTRPSSMVPPSMSPSFCHAKSSLRRRPRQDVAAASTRETLRMRLREAVVGGGHQAVLAAPAPLTHTGRPQCQEADPGPPTMATDDTAAALPARAGRDRSHRLSGAAKVGGTDGKDKEEAASVVVAEMAAVSASGTLVWVAEGTMAVRMAGGATNTRPANGAIFETVAGSAIGRYHAAGAGADAGAVQMGTWEHRNDRYGKS